MSRFTLQLGFWTAVILAFFGTANQVILAGALKSGSLVTMEPASLLGFSSPALGTVGALDGETI